MPEVPAVPDNAAGVVVASSVYPDTRQVPMLERVDLGEIPYQEAAGLMERWVAQRRAGEIGDRLFLLSHPAVVTYGRRTEPGDLPAAASRIPVVEVDRGRASGTSSTLT